MADSCYVREAGLPPRGIHVPRHSAVKLRRDAGASIESVSQFLDHSLLAVTTTYLRRLEGQRDERWKNVADAGVSIARTAAQYEFNGVSASTKALTPPSSRSIVAPY